MTREPTTRLTTSPLCEARFSLIKLVVFRWDLFFALLRVIIMMMMTNFNLRILYELADLKVMEYNTSVIQDLILL